jgi:sensor c-di-GMP phosphodiesterase-like protein
MRRNIALAATLVAVLVAIVVPLLAAIQIATREAERAEVNHVLGYAREVLNRAETTANQIDEATRLLAAVASPDPCSARSIALMRRIDLASSYIQAVGHVLDNSMVWSSLGAEPEGLDIGPVDLITPGGV